MNFPGINLEFLFYDLHIHVFQNAVQLNIYRTCIYDDQTVPRSV